MRKITGLITGRNHVDRSWPARNIKLAKVVAVILPLAGLLHNSAFGSDASLLLPTNVSLAWDRSSSPGVAGYRIYYGSTSGIYTNNVTVGNVTNYTFSNLVSGVRYYLAAKAYNVLGVESAFSNEISYLAPGEQPTLRITVAANKRATLTITGRSGRTYQVQASTNLAAWSVLGTVTITNGSTATFTDANAPSHVRRYYRVRDISP